jgi:hypothetical protein
MVHAGRTEPLPVPVPQTAEVQRPGRFGMTASGLESLRPYYLQGGQISPPRSGFPGKSTTYSNMTLFSVLSDQRIQTGTTFESVSITFSPENFRVHSEASSHFVSRTLASAADCKCQACALLNARSLGSGRPYENEN